MHYFLGVIRNTLEFVSDSCLKKHKVFNITWCFVYTITHAIFNICGGFTNKVCVINCTYLEAYFLPLHSFLSIYMRTQPMCAPWRTAFCSYTKASRRTQSQCWWVYLDRDMVWACSLCLIIINHLLCFFFLPILILKETVVKLKSFADNFSSYTHFLQKILPYQLKRSVLLVRAQWQNGVEQTIDDYPLFSFQLGRRVRGASLYCCTYREKPGAAGRHEESNFCVWETAELH